MNFEFWYVSLPSGDVLRRETVEGAANRELSELVARGWEPLSVTRPSNLDRVGFLLRRPKPAA